MIESARRSGLCRDQVVVSRAGRDTIVLMLVVMAAKIVSNDLRRFAVSLLLLLVVSVLLVLTGQQGSIETHVLEVLNSRRLLKV